jgi:sulfate permease, SulP family
VTAADPRSLGGRRPIVAPWLREYRRAWLGRDLVAGVVTACVVVPQCIAYATLAGLPVEVGLYVATVPMLAYALLGTSRPLSVSVTSTISILTAAAVADSGADDPRAAAAALAVLVGSLLLIVGLLRLGFLANLVSAPILAGFKAGTALVIISGQLGKVMGIRSRGRGSSRTSPTWLGASTTSKVAPPCSPPSPPSSSSVCAISRREFRLRWSPWP